jgi:hypothetical protein
MDLFVRSRFYEDISDEVDFLLVTPEALNAREMSALRQEQADPAEEVSFERETSVALHTICPSEWKQSAAPQTTRRTPRRSRDTWGCGTLRHFLDCAA